MTAKSVLVRPQGLRTRARAPTCPPCYATEPMQHSSKRTRQEPNFSC